MSQGAKVALLVTAIVVVVCCGIGTVVLFPLIQKGAKIGFDSAMFADQSMTAVCTRWDADALLSRLSDQAKKTVSEDQVRAMCAQWKAKYGGIRNKRSVGTAMDANAAMESGQAIRLDITFDTVFEKGSAQVKLRVVTHGKDAYKLDRFLVDEQGVSSGPATITPAAAPDSGSLAAGGAFGDGVLTTVFKTWNVSDLQDRASRELLRAKDKTEMAAMLNDLKAKLGTYRSGKGRVTLNPSEGVLDRTKPETATYRAQATFEKGQADVELQLVKRPSEGWQILDLSVKPR